MIFSYIVYVLMNIYGDLDRFGELQLHIKVAISEISN